jgi:hypothetical protein
MIADALGFVAAGLVLATFCMRSMRALRLVALASNVAFLAYGMTLDLLPVAMLHGLLMPVNLVRLGELARPPRLARTARADPRAPNPRARRTCDHGSLLARFGRPPG